MGAKVLGSIRMKSMRSGYKNIRLSIENLVMCRLILNRTLNRLNLRHVSRSLTTTSKVAREGSQAAITHENLTLYNGKIGLIREIMNQS